MKKYLSRYISSFLKRLLFYKKVTRFYYEVVLKKRTPIIVYQMGKVGSSSVFYSLKEMGVSPVFHIHKMNAKDIARLKRKYKKRGRVLPLNLLLGDFLRSKVVDKGRPARYITLIRNPVDRNISAFFQNFKIFVGVEPEKYEGSIAKLISIFESEYDREIPFVWLRKEIEGVLGIDVFEKKFPKNKGYMMYREEEVELLVLRTSIDDKIKSKALEEFLGLKHLKIVRKNVAINKNYNNLYRKFNKKIKLNKTYARIISQSRLVNHFLTKKEKREMLDLV